jgi:hypothetical protein
MGYEINWHIENAGDPVLKSPQYQKWSQYAIGELASPPMIALIKTAIKDARASRESAAVINYLAWLLRTTTLVADG